MFQEGGVYRIRGIVSLTIAVNDENVCSSDSYVVFTNVAKYLDWIQKVVPQIQTSAVPSGKQVTKIICADCTAQSAHSL